VLLQSYPSTLCVRNTVSRDYDACAAAAAQAAATDAFKPRDLLSACHSTSISCCGKARISLSGHTPLSLGNSSLWAAPERTIDHSTFCNVREIRAVHLRSSDPFPVRPFTKQTTGNKVEFDAARVAFDEAHSAWQAEKDALSKPPVAASVLSPSAAPRQSIPRT